MAHAHGLHNQWFGHPKKTPTDIKILGDAVRERERIYVSTEKKRERLTPKKKKL